MAKLNTYSLQTSLDSSSQVLAIVPSSDGTTFGTYRIPVGMIGSVIPEATYNQATVLTDYGVYMGPADVATALASVGIRSVNGIFADDCDTITKSGDYAVSATTTNGPTGVTGFLKHYVLGGGWDTQTLFTNEGSFYIRTKNGSDGTWYPWDLKYQKTPNTNNMGTVAAGGSVTFYVQSAPYSSATLSGDATITIDSWFDSGKYSEVRLGLTQTASGTVTWTNTIQWTKPDGTTSTSFSDTGITWPTSGTIHIDMWSADGGTTIYGKVV